MGSFASNQVSDREVSNESSISHFNGWCGDRDRGCAAGAGNRGGPNLDSAANGGRPAGLAGSVGLPDHHADGATLRAWDAGIFYRPGSVAPLKSRKSSA